MSSVVMLKREEFWSIVVEYMESRRDIYSEKQICQACLDWAKFIAKIGTIFMEKGFSQKGVDEDETIN